MFINQFFDIIIKNQFSEIGRVFYQKNRSTKNLYIYIINTFAKSLVQRIKK